MIWNAFNFETKIENLEKIIKLNEIIFNFYNSYNDNYFNEININNLLLNYCENENIINKIIKEECRNNYDKILTLINQ